jgi:hypothetical protein
MMDAAGIAQDIETLLKQNLAKPFELASELVARPADRLLADALVDDAA